MYVRAGSLGSQKLFFTDNPPTMRHLSDELGMSEITKGAFRVEHPSLLGFWRPSKLLVLLWYCCCVSSLYQTMILGLACFQGFRSLLTHPKHNDRI